MAPVIKLTYFPARGRAELARLCMAQGGLAFKDERIAQDAWPTLKPKTPFGTMPLLEYDGEVIGQSLTICRFLARKAGIGGRNELEQAKADMIVEHFKDFTDEYVKIVFGPKESKKALQDKFFDVFLPGLFGKAEKILAAASGCCGYFVGNHLTYADVAAFEAIDKIEDTKFAAFADCRAKVDKLKWKIKFPKLAKLYEKVKEEPGISGWLKKRPQTVL